MSRTCKFRNPDGIFLVSYALLLPPLSLCTLRVAFPVFAQNLCRISRNQYFPAISRKELLYLPSEKKIKNIFILFVTISKNRGISR
jgi:hypothetical protein